MNGEVTRWTFKNLLPPFCRPSPKISLKRLLDIDSLPRLSQKITLKTMYEWEQRIQFIQCGYKFIPKRFMSAMKGQPRDLCQFFPLIIIFKRCCVAFEQMGRTFRIDTPLKLIPERF